MSEGNSDLPSGWARATIGDVTFPRVPQTGPGEDSQFTYIDISSVDNQEKRITEPKVLPTRDAPSRARQQVQTSDVLVSMTRPNLNAVALVPDDLNDAIASTGFDVLRATQVDPRWLYFIVRSPGFVSAMSELVQGALYPAVRSADIRGYEIPVPPLSEQRRITAKIEELQARSRTAREALEAIPPLLESFRQSVLAAAFRGDLTADWREQNPDVEPASVLLERIRAERRRQWEEAELEKMRAKGKEPKDGRWKEKYKEPEEVDASALPGLPEGWAWAAMTEIAESALGKMLDRSKHRSGIELPYLRNINVRWAGIDTSDMLTMFFKEEEVQRYSVGSGDVLVCEGGEPGRAAVWEHEDRAMYQKALHRVRPFAGVDPRWIMYHIWRDAAGGDLEQHFSGTTIKHFTGIALARYPVRVAPTAEQQVIATRLEQTIDYCTRLGQAVEELLLRVGDADQSILAKAFRGELVPQEPTDEPASALLERIREERKLAFSTAKRGRRFA